MTKTCAPFDAAPQAPLAFVAVRADLPLREQFSLAALVTLRAGAASPAGAPGVPVRVVATQSPLDMIGLRGRLEELGLLCAEALTGSSGARDDFGAIASVVPEPLVAEVARALADYEPWGVESLVAGALSAPTGAPAANFAEIYERLQAARAFKAAASSELVEYEYAVLAGVSTAVQLARSVCQSMGLSDPFPGRLIRPGQTLDSVAFEDGHYVVEATDTYRDEEESLKVVIPQSFLADDAESAIRAHYAEVRRLAQVRKSEAAQAKAAEDRAKDLQQLRDLQRRYPEHAVK